ncbi:MAG: peptidoglycan-binding protein [Hyphomicrobiales bacterium]|nr:peptidoglycan-binding protein [Hyphomicrobiales bacterium]
MLDESQLRAIYPKAPDAHVAAFLDRGGDLFADYGIDATPVRLHFFLAQVGHESGGLTITAENLNYSAERLCKVWPNRFPDADAAAPFARNPRALANNVYASRMGNGGPETDDGWTFRGRGYIQVTGREGYRRVGAIAALPLEEQPDLAVEPAHALPVACAFWRWKGLNAICDAGNFVSVTRRINGGTNGLADRRAWLDKVRRVLGTEGDTGVALDTADVIELQRALQAAGYPEVGAADGIVGSRTLAGITRFRHEHGLPDGAIDGALLAALGLAG